MGLDDKRVSGLRDGNTVSDQIYTPTHVNTFTTRQSELVSY